MLGRGKNGNNIDLKIAFTSDSFKPRSFLSSEHEFFPNCKKIPVILAWFMEGSFLEQFSLPSYLFGHLLEEVGWPGYSVAPSILTSYNQIFLYLPFSHNPVQISSPESGSLCLLSFFPHNPSP